MLNALGDPVWNTLKLRSWSSYVLRTKTTVCTKT